MKGKDLLFLTGGALLVYLLIPKEKAQAAAGGVSILGIPAPGQIVPEINIPEFKFPDIDIPEFPGFEFPDWDKFFPDWEKLIPDASEFAVEKILEKVLPEEVGALEGTVREVTSQWDEYWNNFTKGLQVLGLTPAETAAIRRGEGVISETGEYSPIAQLSTRAKIILYEQELAAKDASIGLPEEPSLPQKEYEPSEELLGYMEKAAPPLWFISGRKEEPKDVFLKGLIGVM